MHGKDINAEVRKFCEGLSCHKMRQVRIAINNILFERIVEHNKKVLSVNVPHTENDTQWKVNEVQDDRFTGSD